MSLCLNTYKRHHTDPDRLKYEGISVCMRCAKILYEMVNGGKRWLDNADAHLGATEET